MVPFPAISKKTKDRLIFGTLIVTLLVISWSLSFRFTLWARGPSGTPFLTIALYDVGQGDSILIARGETQVLVDGGPDDSILSLLGRDMLPWDRKIELMVLTHPHADHVAGLLSVLERYQVERVLLYPVVYDTKVYQEFLDAIEEEGAVIMRGVSGTVIDLSGVRLKVLWPQDGFSDTNINNNSIVLAVSYGEFDALLLGDAEREAQIRFASVASGVEVLKVAHQGAQDGLYGPLLERISPELALISVGAGNTYGPSPRFGLGVAGAGGGYYPKDGSLRDDQSNERWGGFLVYFGKETVIGKW